MNPSSNDIHRTFFANLIEIIFGDATRFLRSTLHGCAALETSGGFEMPVDIERNYGRLVESVVTALASCF